MSLTGDEIRNKNKSLLLTDIISDEEVQTAYEDALIHFKTRLYEELDYQISDDNIPSQGWICIKLISASSLIKDNYPDSKEAIEIANAYYSEANTLIKALIKGSEMKASGVAVKSNKRASFQADIDTYSKDFREKLRNKYR